MYLTPLIWKALCQGVYELSNAVALQEMRQDTYSQVDK